MNIGFKKILIPDSINKVNLEVAIWYPTQSQPQEESFNTIKVQIAKNAKPFNKSLGLIIISHGFSGNFLSHNDTAQYLARLGYIVATPTHPDLQGLRSGKPGLDPLVARTLHIQQTINQVMNHKDFKAHDLRNRIGLIGFSIGGYAALTAAGAIPDFSSLHSYCEQNIKDHLLCSRQAKHRFATIESKLTTKRDFEIKAAVLLAPAYGPLFTQSDLSAIEIPIKLIAAENDQELNNQFNVSYFKSFLPTASAINFIKDAGHFTFIAPCSNELKNAAPSICKDPVGVDREEIHKQLNKDIAVFFEYILKQKETEHMETKPTANLNGRHLPANNHHTPECLE